MTNENCSQTFKDTYVLQSWTSFLNPTWAANKTCSFFMTLSLLILMTHTSIYLFLVVVQLLSHDWLFASLWTTASQAPLSSTISWNWLKFMYIESMMLFSHLILCSPLLLLPPIIPNIGAFSNESAFCMTWPEYWSFSFSLNPSNKYSRLISFRVGWLISLQSKGLSRIFSSTTIQKYQFFSTQPSLWSNSHICIWLLEKPYHWLCIIFPGNLVGKKFTWNAEDPGLIPGLERSAGE